MENSKENKEVYIIRECAPDGDGADLYFDGDCFSASGWGGDYRGNMFVVLSEGRRGGLSCINSEEWDAVCRLADDIADDFERVGDYWKNGKEIMDYHSIPFTPKRCHDLKEWAKGVGYYCGGDPEAVADFLSIIHPGEKGKRWDVVSATGYSQGDYAQAVFCGGFYGEDDARKCAEVALGCYTEYSVEYPDGDVCYGFVIPHSVAWGGEDAKKEVIDWAGIPDDAEVKMYEIDGYITSPNYREV